MIYEFRTYTTPIGMAPELARLSAEIGRDIRKDDYGKLEGYWLTEIGPLNQVMHLWSYADLNTRQALRAGSPFASTCIRQPRAALLILASGASTTPDSPAGPPRTTAQ